MIALETPRLRLRPFELADASEVQRMAGDPAVAATTLSVPHPYPDGAAAEWIKMHATWRERGEAFTFAIDDKSSGKLVGCISIEISKAHRRGMLGYWVGKEFWNRGYASEATKRLVEFGLEELKLVRVYAYHLASNPASGKVMKNAGMQQEGYFRNYVIKAGKAEDCVFYGIVSSGP